MQSDLNKYWEKLAGELYQIFKKKKININPSQMLPKGRRVGNTF